MCILRFRARAGYLQHYETLLKELNVHPASDPVPPDQYEVERAALSDRNLNVPFWHSLSFNAGHAPSPTDTIKDIGNIDSCQCTYLAVMCIYMCIQCTYMYVHVYQFNMLCLASQHTFFNWLCTP